MGRILMAIRIYSGNHGKAAQGADSLTPSLRAVKAERKEERETRRDAFTG